MSQPTTDVESNTDAPDDQYEDRLIPGHEYDGIQEYDNPIPPWLSLLFGGTVIWSLFYLVAINLGYIDDYETNLEQGQEELAMIRQQAEAGTEKVDAAKLQTVAKDESYIDSGEKVFTAKCASCHGKKAQGMVGPNLTDKYWIHGGSLKNIYQTIQDGVPDKGMPPWGSRLDQEETLGVVAFVRSVRGTNPPNAKEPEGDPWEPKQ